MDVYNFKPKIILVGDQGVGKRSLYTNFSPEKATAYQEGYKQTIGVEFSIIPMKIGEYEIKIELWDMGDQERFSYIRPLYYKGAVGGLMVYDVTNRTSFENITKYFNEIVDSATKIPVYLVGNKADLPNRVVSNGEGWSLAKKLTILYIETSAKTGQNVQEMFKRITEMAIAIWGIDERGK